jgi:hypothetical protein
METLVMRWLKRALVPLALTAAACGGGVVTPGSGLNDSLRELPDVPGCADVRGVPVGTLVMTSIPDVVDLYLVSDNGAPLCIDSREGIKRRFGDAVENASSNPMPGEGQRVSSNPMPGSPGDPASSNPMPGTGPADSNPMPGHDPGAIFTRAATH